MLSVVIALVASEPNNSFLKANQALVTKLIVYLPGKLLIEVLDVS
jgi:hypothetical protein